jgi:phage gpG-like protein
MIEIQVDPSRAIAKLERLTPAIRSALRGTIVTLTQALAATVRAKLSGGVLQMRTGALFRSIKSEMVENTATIYGRVYSDGVRYAAIHEFGGTIQHPGSSKFQAWQGAEGWIYTHFTRPHAIPIPERSYLRSSLAEMRDDIVDRLTEAVRSAAREAA